MSAGFEWSLGGQGSAGVIPPASGGAGSCCSPATPALRGSGQKGCTPPGASPHTHSQLTAHTACSHPPLLPPKERKGPGLALPVPLEAGGVSQVCLETTPPHPPGITKLFCLPVGNGTKLPFQFSSVGQNPPGDFSKQSDGSLFTKTGTRN